MMVQAQHRPLEGCHSGNHHPENRRVRLAVCFWDSCMYKTVYIKYNYSIDWSLLMSFLEKK